MEQQQISGTPVTSGALTPEQIVNTCSYIAYACNRDYGMTHEGAVRIGIGNDNFRAIYEAEQQEHAARFAEGAILKYDLLTA